MKVLQLCKKSPTPQKDGESIAIHQITRALTLKKIEVEVLAMLTPKHSQKDTKAELPGVAYHYVHINTEISLFKTLTSLWGASPYLVERFRSLSFEKALKDLLQAKVYDVIILEGVFLALYIPLIQKHSQAKLVLRAHNVENQIWKRLAQEERNALKKGYMMAIMNQQLEKFEEEALVKVDALVSISPLDNQYFIQKGLKKTLVFPVTVSACEPSKLPVNFQVGFLGGLDWLPNRNGVTWFVEHVWLSFIKKHPEANFQLAGRNFPDDIKSWTYPQVELLGEIEEATKFIQAQSLLIAPIFSGSGMRVKIIEAMSQSKAVLSTRVGAEGIGCEDGKNIVLAETKEEWLAALEELYADTSRLNNIGSWASKLIAKDYLLDTHAEKLDLFLRSL